MIVSLGEVLGGTVLAAAAGMKISAKNPGSDRAESLGIIAQPPHLRPTFCAKIPAFLGLSAFPVRH